LIFDERNLTSLDVSDGGGGLMLDIPVGNSAFAEIVRARLDGGTGRFRKVVTKTPEGDEIEDWPVGMNAIPLPADNGDDYLEDFVDRFETFIFNRVLGQAERNLDDEKRRTLANENLRRRNPVNEGRLYFFIDIESHRREFARIKNMIEGLERTWPAISFFSLRHDFEATRRENALLWGLKDLLHDQ